MGKDWDKALPDIEIFRQCLRVLKPGAFAFVMAAPRQDVLSRMMILLETAGFNIDFTSIYWTYATGFPKANNIGKAIDKKLGREREVVGYKKSGIRCKDLPLSTGQGEFTVGQSDVDITAPASYEAKTFEGSYGGFQPKPAVEVIIVVQKPPTEKTQVGQALANGKGITWLDDCRVPYADASDKPKPVIGGTMSADSIISQLAGKERNWEPKNGRFPANLLVSDDVLDDGRHAKGDGEIVMRQAGTGAGLIAQYDGRKTMPKIKEGLQTVRCIKDTGTYSRFFSLDAWAEKNLPFLIVPKASKKEKNAGCEHMEDKPRPNHHQQLGEGGFTLSTGNVVGHYKPFVKNNHPTVKPIKLMSYLITMGSRPGDVVLDPFMGSGSTGCAAVAGGRKFIGIEMSEEYVEIAKARIQHYQENK